MMYIELKFNAMSFKKSQLIFFLLVFSIIGVRSQDTITCPLEIELYQPAILSNAIPIDFNLDGKLEQVSFNGTSDKIYLKRLEGSSSVISTIDNMWATSIFPGYINKDKYPDLIICNDSRISYMLGNGNFSTVRGLTTKKINGRSIQSAFIIDVDNDGDGDILVHYEGLGLYLIENENQVFDWQNMEKIFANNYGGRGFGETCDLNNDGYMDLVFYNPYAGVYTLINNGNKTFSTSRLSSTSNPCYYTAGDINEDGYSDIVMGFENLNGSIEVMLNDGFGRFNKTTAIGGLSYPGALSIVDLNNDAKKDLVV